MQHEINITTAVRHLKYLLRGIEPAMAMDSFA